MQVKFGQEVLILDSWIKRKQYYALCHILGPGLNTHLTENELLRDIFELGARIVINEMPNNKQTKLERVSFTFHDASTQIQLENKLLYSY